MKEGKEETRKDEERKQGEKKKWKNKHKELRKMKRE